MTSAYHFDPTALAAIELRARLRSLAAGQVEAFDLLYHHCGGSSPAGAQINRSTDRLCHPWRSTCLTTPRSRGAALA
jgi:hypothetical protein